MKSKLLLLISVIGLGFSEANAMPGVKHDYWGQKLLNTPIEEGGAAGVSREKLQNINDWMDNPASKTGQYTNSYTGTTIHPTNHNYLRHNPDAVSKVFSGDGSVDLAVKNLARMHKICDVVHNQTPVDGFVLTDSMKTEAQAILDYVALHNSLPPELPSWVDAEGPLKTLAATTSAAVKASDNVSSSAISTENAIVSTSPASKSTNSKTVASEMESADAMTGAAEVAEDSSKLGMLASKAFGILGVAGGSYQCWVGLNECKNGKLFDGGYDILGGTANGIAGGAWILEEPEVAEVAIGVAVLLDGVSDIQVGFRDSDYKRCFLGGVKGTAGCVIVTGVFTLQPECVIGGIIVYGAVVVYEHWEVICDVTTKAANVTADSSVKAAHLISNSTARAAGNIADGAVRAAHVVGDSAVKATNATGVFFSDKTSSIMRVISHSHK